MMATNLTCFADALPSSCDATDGAGAGAPTTLLERILKRKRMTLEARLEALGGLEGLQELMLDTPPVSPPNRLANAVAARSLAGRLAVVAEVCEPTPHTGGEAVASAARAWEAAGADAISVWTDEEYTPAGEEDLRAVARATKLPVMLCDYVLHPLQLVSALKSGACAAPLVAQILRGQALPTLAGFVRPAGMDVVAECVNAADVKAAEEAGVALYGVGLSVGLSLGGIPGAREQIVRGLLAELPFGAFSLVGVSSSLAEIRQAREAGADAIVLKRSILNEGELRGLTPQQVLEAIEPIITGDD